MNILLVFPFKENNNKPKNTVSVVVVCFYLFSLNQNYRENSFLFQQENLRETTKTLKKIHFQFRKS